jgi:hypothetical protein
MSEFAEQELQNFVSKLVKDGIKKIPWGRIRNFCETIEETDKICGKITRQLGIEIIGG